MAFKDKERAKEYGRYWEKYKRSAESKARRKETTRLWILRQRKLRDERELQNGKDLGYEGVKIRDDIRKRIEEGRTKILVHPDKSITCFHKNEDGHWVGHRKDKHKIYLHREIIKQALNLTDEDLRGYVVHHKNENKDDNRPENLEIITQSEHMDRHEALWIKNLSKGRGKYKK